MPCQTEGKNAAENFLDVYLATLMAESTADLDLSSSDSNSDSEGSSSESDDDFEVPLAPASDAIMTGLLGLYSQRYLADQCPINKTKANLCLLLDDWKVNRPEIFRSHLRVMPQCFDLLVATLQDDPVFHNGSNVPQMPVEDQIAIALYRFGHFGNAVSNMKVALWAGVGYGTVCLVTNHVMRAVCGERFCHSALYWPDDTAKEIAKAWVEENSCPAWRDGWLMVDGTLVPLSVRPGYYGNTFFDCKSNYSLNVQVWLIYQISWLHLICLIDCVYP